MQVTAERDLSERAEVADQVRVATARVTPVLARGPVYRSSQSSVGTVVSAKNLNSRCCSHQVRQAGIAIRWNPACLFLLGLIRRKLRGPGDTSASGSLRTDNLCKDVD